MFIAALFTTAKRWKLPKCPSAGGWETKCGTYEPHNHISFHLRAAALPWACAVETATAPAPRSLLPPAAMASAAASAAAAAAEEGEGREEARTRRTARLPRPEAAMMAMPARLWRPRGGGLSAVPSQPPAALAASHAACSVRWGRSQEGSGLSKPWTRRPGGSRGPKWLLIRRGPPLGPQRGEPPLRRGSATFSPARPGAPPRPLSEMRSASLFQSPDQDLSGKKFSTKQYGDLSSRH